MKKELAIGGDDDAASKAGRMASIYENWPEIGENTRLDEDKTVGMSEIRKLRIQMVLAVNPLGIPSLAFCDAYAKMFGRPLDIKALGFDHLAHMVSSLTEVFTVQEPDEITAAMFPDFAQDYILHDARLGHDFEKPNLDIPLETNGLDPNLLNSHAWLNRDDDFPHDVALAGEQYSDLILPMTSANIPGTHGLYRAVIVGAANPNRFHINIKSESYDKVSRLSADVAAYFRDSETPIEAYSVPKEFIYPGFPCLVYQPKQNIWERVEIVGRSAHKKQNKIVVKTVDYGEEFMVDPIYLYLMPRAFLDIPKQGVAVSIIGLTPPARAGRWDAGAGTRLRCFSNLNYWLDCVLVDPKPAHVTGDGADKDKASSAADGIKSLSIEDDSNKKKRKRKQVDFELLICDRNDPDFNVYLDEILAFETHADKDKTRIEEVENLRSKMEKTMETVQRPINPLGQPS